MTEVSGKIRSYVFKIEQKDMLAFRIFSGDMNPIHLSDIDAKTYGCNQQVVFGMLTTLFAFKIIKLAENIISLTPQGIEIKFNEIVCLEKNYILLWKTTSCTNYENLEIDVKVENDDKIVANIKLLKCSFILYQNHNTLTCDLISEVEGATALARISSLVGNDCPGHGSLLGRVKIDGNFTSISDEEKIIVTKQSLIGSHHITSFDLGECKGTYHSVLLLPKVPSNQ